MKVLIVTFEFLPFSGGIAVYTGLVADGLSTLGYEVVVLAPAYPGCEALDRSVGFETLRMNVTHGKAEVTRVIPGLWHLSRALRSVEPDVALLTSDLAHGLGAVTCVARGIPYVAVVHGSEVAKHFPPRTLKQRLQSRALKFCYERAQQVVCVSEYVRNSMQRAGFAGANLRVIRNGVPGSLVAAPYRPALVDAIRHRHGLTGKKIILTLSRLVPRKGHAQLIEALPEILSRHPNAVYLIVGKGEFEEQLKALSAKKKVEHAVLFAGEIPEDAKVGYLDLCDVFVLLSRSDGQRVEGLGISLLEAAGRSKPLVGARHGGITEVIEHDRSGYLVDPLDSRTVAARVCALLDDPDLAHTMGAAARERVLQEFLASRMIAEVRRVLEQAAAQPAVVR
jgi:phosphatidylinositol alpha-1,6-mannosyltransferase